MPDLKITDDELIRDFPKLGATGVAQKYNMTVRVVHARRRRVEGELGIIISSPKDKIQQHRRPSPRVRKDVKLKDGTIVVFNDAHYWPNDISTAHLALLDVCKKLKPAIVVANGDLLDGARISRHPPISWEHAPELVDELETVRLRLDEIKKAAKGAKCYWTAGNHDLRFESKLAKEAPEFRGIKGMHLKDHFPEWIPCMSIWVNGELVIKHRFKGGIHARHNNILVSGKSIVTGHTHQQGVTPFTDYNGTRYGVESGTLSETFGPQYEYAEDNPRNWVSGFAVITFQDGQLLTPELVKVVDTGIYEFRGRRVEVVPE